MISEIKRDIDYKFAVFQIFGLLLLFGTSVGYVDYSGKGISIIQLLLDIREGNYISNGSINGFELWCKGISTYASVMYPILTCLGFSISIYYEKLGARRTRLIREKRLRYCFEKVTGAVVSSGVLFMISYMVFGILVQIRILSSFPSTSINRNDVISCVVRLSYSFIYGMALSLFIIVISVFFDDKYELVCLPILVKYMVLIISNRIGIMGARSNGNVFFRHISEVMMNPENLISNYSSLREKTESFIVAFVFFIMSIVVMNYKIKRDEKNGNI